MPEIIDWQEPPRRRRGSFFLLLAAILVVLFASRTALSYYVEALWFASLGYEEVFQKTLSLQWIAFAVSSATTFLMVYGWFLALRRLYEDNLPSGSTIFIGSQPVRLPVERILRLMALLVSFIIAVITGGSIMGEWLTFALYFSAPNSTGTVDPNFFQAR